jgi:hypothetical protein
MSKSQGKLLTKIIAEGILRFFCAYLGFLKANLGWHRNQ